LGKNHWASEKTASQRFFQALNRPKKAALGILPRGKNIVSMRVRLARKKKKTAGGKEEARGKKKGMGTSFLTFFRKVGVLSYKKGHDLRGTVTKSM